MCSHFLIKYPEIFLFWRWTKRLRTLKFCRRWMKPGWRWDLKSRTTWKRVQTFVFYRFESSSALPMHVFVSSYAWLTFFFSHNVLQDLLKRPEVAVLVNMRLENTPWTASQIAHFLSTPSPNAERKPGSPMTWLDLYNDLSHVTNTVAQVTKVLLFMTSLF